MLTLAARRVLASPAGFVLRVLRGFAASQCLLLAGAIAYYALLSLLPLLILAVILLSHLVDQQVLVQTVGQYLEWLIPSQSQALLADISAFLDARGTIGLVLFATLLFFSAQAFAAVEKAMAAIFSHRSAERPRHPLISAILPYSFVLLLIGVLFCLTVLFIVLQMLTAESIQLFGRQWSLQALSQPGFLLLGLAVEVLIFAALYMIMPVGRTRPAHALIGGLTAALLWEATRQALTWYFSTLSKVGVVYGSLSTAVVVLFSLEIAAILLLLGAQVIAEYERIGLE